MQGGDDQLLGALGFPGDELVHPGDKTRTRGAGWVFLGKRVRNSARRGVENERFGERAEGEAGGPRESRFDQRIDRVLT